MSISFIISTAQGMKRQDIEKEIIIIGQSRTSDLIIDDPSVSTKHAVIECQNGFIYLTDLNSPNGTFVNGQSVNSRIEISSSDQLQIGSVPLNFSLPEDVSNQTVKLSLVSQTGASEKPEPVDYSTLPGVPKPPVPPRLPSQTVPHLPPQIEMLAEVPAEMPMQALPTEPPNPPGNPYGRNHSSGPINPTFPQQAPQQDATEKFYLTRQGQNYGPYSWADIYQMGQERRLFAGDLIMSPQSAQLTNWTPVEGIDALRPLLVPLKKTSSKRLAIILSVCCILIAAAILIFGFTRLGPGFASKNEANTLEEETDGSNSDSTLLDETQVPERIQVPPMDDIRVLGELIQGQVLEVFSDVPGKLEILTDSDEFMGLDTGDQPQLSCRVPTDQKAYKINFEPADGTLGTQRIFFHEPGQKTTHIQISRGKDANDTILFSKTFVTAQSANQAGSGELRPSGSKEISIEELEKEFGQSGSETVKNQSKKISQKKKPVQKPPSQKKTTETKPDLTELVWNQYVIPPTKLWSKNSQKSNETTLTLQSDSTGAQEMVVLDNKVYAIEKKDSRKFIKEMYKSFKRDPSYSKTDLDRRSKYTVLGDEKCPMITMIGNDAMKMFVFLPYHDGNFYVMIAVTSNLDDRELSANLKQIMEQISLKTEP